MRARYYDPAIGRFISEDPARDGLNWYGYCDANPVNLVDPEGRLPGPPWDWWMRAIAYVVIATMLLYYVAQISNQAGLGEHEPPEPYRQEPLKESWPEEKVERAQSIVDFYKTSGNELQKIAASIVEAMVWSEIALWQ